LILASYVYDLSSDMYLQVSVASGNSLILMIRISINILFLQQMWS